MARGEPSPIELARGDNEGGALTAVNIKCADNGYIVEPRCEGIDPEPSVFENIKSTLAFVEKLFKEHEKEEAAEEEEK